jgi:hypothetical protein
MCNCGNQLPPPYQTPPVQAPAPIQQAAGPETVGDVPETADNSEVAAL